jgi:56kDa selenium binding protein (SBP56)
MSHDSRCCASHVPNVQCSLFSPWDRQFYPDMLKQGSQLLRINVDTENGGLAIDDVGRLLSAALLNQASV